MLVILVHYRFSLLLLSLLAFPMAASKELRWPSYNEGDPETLPTLEVSLDPPPGSQQLAKGSLALFDAKREQLETAAMRRIAAAYEMARRDAESCIGSVVGRALHAMGAERGDGFAFMQVALFQEPATSPRIS